MLSALLQLHFVAIVALWCHEKFTNTVTIGSGNCLSPVRCQAITWDNTNLLSIVLFHNYFSLSGEQRKQHKVAYKQNNQQL